MKESLRGFSIALLLGRKMPAVEGRRANLMFSQRNNPYCDLLKILSAKIVKNIRNAKFYAAFMLLFSIFVTKQIYFLLFVSCFFGCDLL